MRKPSSKHSAVTIPRCLPGPGVLGWSSSKYLRGIVQRNAMTPKDFRSLAELARHLMDFAQHYRTVSRAFEWTFTRAKLDAVIEKIARHQRAAPLALAA